MSRSGILFEGVAPLRAGAQCEVHLTLAAPYRVKKGTLVRFKAVIVRSSCMGLSAARIFAPRLQRIEASYELQAPSGSRLLDHKASACGNKGQ